MRVEKRNGYRVVVGGPVPPQAEAITLGATIFVRKRSCEHQGLMAHELVHVYASSKKWDPSGSWPGIWLRICVTDSAGTAIWPPIGASLSRSKRRG